MIASIRFPIFLWIIVGTIAHSEATLPPEDVDGNPPKNDKASQTDGLTEAAKQNILNESEKLYILIGIYSKKWPDIMSKLTNEENDSYITQKEIGGISQAELVAALYEIYQSIQFNLVSWHCSFFRKMCPRHTDDVTAQKCAQFGKFMSWYTGKLKAKEFINAFNAARTETKDIDGKSLEYNVEELANKIDTILDHLRIVNKVFVEANLNYEDIFEKLKKAGVSLDDSETKPFAVSGDFFLKPRYLFIKNVVSEYTYVMNYVNLFLDTGAPIISDFRQIIPNYEITKTIWKNIKKMENSETRYSTVRQLLSLEKRNLKTKLAFLRINVPNKLGEKSWKIEKKTDGPIDYHIQLI